MTAGFSQWTLRPVDTQFPVHPFTRDAKSPYSITKWLKWSILCCVYFAIKKKLKKMHACPTTGVSRQNGRLSNTVVIMALSW